jgi:hypothetical protein
MVQPFEKMSSNSSKVKTYSYHMIYKFRTYIYTQEEWKHVYTKTYT